MFKQSLLCFGRRCSRAARNSNAVNPLDSQIDAQASPPAMSLDVALDVILGITPVPGLSAAFTLLKFIISAVEELQACRKQLGVLAQTLGQLLATLQTEFQSGRLIVSSCVRPLTELKNLLEDVHRFVRTEQDRGFLKALLNRESVVTSIEAFYRRIGAAVNNFQITALLNINHMLRHNESARCEDMDALNMRFSALEISQTELRRALEINQNNILAMMVSIERRLDRHNRNDTEHGFYSHALHYLRSTSGKMIKLEDWMISAFDVDYGPEIGAGGFGTVFQGTSNRTEVAIKVVHNA
ncbi:hypothetical protein B0H10DRAFT_1276144 [Mycena sp. CBHHK59/15]|nr:hypothetical protein B0H10DRAFT_1276144 [Mycena sp. CBHHK59/15]